MIAVHKGGGRNPRSLWGRFTQVILNLHSPSLGYAKDCWCWSCWKTTCDSTCMCGWKSGPCSSYADAMNQLHDHIWYGIHNGEK